MATIFFVKDMRERERGLLVVAPLPPSVRRPRRVRRGGRRGALSAASESEEQGGSPLLHDSKEEKYSTRERAKRGSLGQEQREREREREKRGEQIIVDRIARKRADTSTTHTQKREKRIFLQRFSFVESEEEEVH